VTLASPASGPPTSTSPRSRTCWSIQGRKREETPEGEMVHVGIANRGFERRFELADFVRVERADLADGCW
jgi:molecular chaperone IbpA